MTTLWARMLVIKAFEKGEITEECAHYFDKLLHENSFSIKFIDHEPIREEIKFFNKDFRTLSVLKQIGGGDHFDVLNYINKTSFKKGYTIGEETVYLANIIKEDYKGLTDSVRDQFDIPQYAPLIKGGEWSKETNLISLLTLKNYLEKTNYICYTSDDFNNNLENAIKLLRDKNKIETKEKLPKTMDNDPWLIYE